MFLFYFQVLKTLAFEQVLTHEIVMVLVQYGASLQFQELGEKTVNIVKNCLMDD